MLVVYCFRSVSFYSWIVCVPDTKIRSYSSVCCCIFFFRISCRKDLVLAEGFVFTLPTTAGFVAVVPFLETTFGTFETLGFTGAFFGINSY